MQKYQQICNFSNHINRITVEAGESILGQWMEETLRPTDATDTQTPPPVPARVDVPSEGKRSRKISSGDSPVFIPDKREPAGVMEILLDIL